MFTWICPKCKMEVPPHLSECPNCAGTQDQPAAAGNGEPVSTAAPPAPQQTAPQQALPPRRSGLPGWVVSLLVAGGLVGGGALMYLFFLPGLRGKTEAPAAKVETPGAAKTQHPYAKFLEVTGLRVAEDKKKDVQIKFLVVNHSLAELSDTELKLDIRSSTAKPGDTPLCEVRVKVPALGPHESRDVTAAGKTQLRAYEMPDWQFLRADYEILSPK